MGAVPRAQPHVVQSRKPCSLDFDISSMRPMKWPNRRSSGSESLALSVCNSRADWNAKVYALTDRAFLAAGASWASHDGFGPRLII